MSGEHAYAPSENGRPRQSLIRSISWLGAATLATKPLGFLFVTAACMRVLGRDDYGYFTVALSLAFISASFVDLGSGGYTIRELVRSPERGATVVGGLLSLRIVLSTLSVVVCLAAGFALGFRNERLAGIGVASIYVIALLATSYYRAIFEAFGDLKTDAIILVIEKVAVVAIGLVGLLLLRSPLGALMGMAAGMVVGLAIARAVSRGRFLDASASLSGLSQAPELLGKIAVIGLTGLFAAVYLRTDQVMVEAFLGDDAAGLYGAAFRIIEAFMVVPTIIASSALYPRLVMARESARRTDYRRTFARGAAVLVLLGLVMWIATIVLADTALNVLAGGDAFAAAGWPLRVLAGTLPFLFVNSLLYAALLGFDDERWLATCMLCVAAINIVGNLILIPRVGIIGAASTTVASEIILLIAYVVRIRSVMSSAVFREEVRPPKVD